MTICVRTGRWVVTAAVPLLSACGTLFTGAPASNPGSETDQAALHYFVPEDVVEVVATIERTTTTKLTGELDAPRKETAESLAVASAIVNLQTVPDTSKAYVLDAGASGLTRNNTALTVSETGLLQSVNAKTTGTGGVVFENVMKLAGSVLPLVNLVSGNLSAGPKSPMFDPQVFLQESNRNFVQGAYMSLQLSEKAADEAGACDPVDANAVLSKHLPQTIEYYFAFPKLASRAQLVDEFCDTLLTLEVRRDSYRRVLGEFDSENDGVRLGILNGKLTNLRSEYYAAAETHRRAREAIAASVVQRVQDAGIGKKVQQYTSREILHFGSLPSPQAIVAVNKKESTTEAELLTAIQAAAFSEGVTSLYETTGVLVTATPMIAPVAPHAPVAGIGGTNGGGTNGNGADTPPGQTGNVSNGNSCSGSPKGEKAMPCVFYRTPRSYLLTAWTPHKSAATKPADVRVRLVPSDSKVVDAITDEAPVRMIELRESRWTKRDSTLTFSPRGRLTGVTRDYGSAAEDASGSIATGFQEGIKQYSTTLTSLKTIRETENQIELLPLQQQLAIANARASVELQPLTHDLAMATAQSAIDMQEVQAQVSLAQQQIELINKQVALQATSQGQTTALEAQLAGIQNTLVSAQRTLIESQASLAAARVTGEDAAARATLTAAGTMLQAQIQQLTNEIALLKLKNELEDLKKPKG